MRQAAKVDANHYAIACALRQLGCRVLDLSRVGKGCPDLLICRGNRLALIEIKDGDKAPSKRKLTDHQQRFHRDWPVLVVESVDQAIAVARGLLA